MSSLRLALPAALGLALFGCGTHKSAEIEDQAAADRNQRSSYAMSPEMTPAQRESAAQGRGSTVAGSTSATTAATPTARPESEPVDAIADRDADPAEPMPVADAPVSLDSVSVTSGVLGGADLGGDEVDEEASRQDTRTRMKIAQIGTRGKKSEEIATKGLELKKRPGPSKPAPGTVTTPTRVPALPPGVVESQTEDYTDYGINGFTLTDRDNLSTFAADVDTASYTITRRKLREGYLPPPAAVRVEEFVNYFPYEYAQPKKGHPFAVDVEASPSPFNPRNHIVRIGVQGKKVHFDTRRPVNLTFLVDVSGSMQSRDKIGLLKDTLRMLTEELDDGDTVALVTYAGATKVVLAPTPISQRGRILSALNGLTAGGSTAMGAGINLAYQQAEAGFRPGAVNRVIVASDGDANVGVTSHSQLSNFISGKAKKGITLTTLGFGNGNYKDTMMERLANDGDGNYFYIDSLQESRRLFVDQLSSTLEVIAKDVKLQVEWNPDTVLAYRLIGYENRDIADKDFRNDAVDAGEIGAGHQVTALYEVALKDDRSAGLGTVRVRNKAPGPESPAVERRYEVPTAIIGQSFATASPQFRLQTAAAGFAEILRGSPHMNEISLRMVGDIARDAKRVEYSEDSELVELIDRAARLRGEGAVSRR